MQAPQRTHPWTHCWAIALLCALVCLPVLTSNAQAQSAATWPIPGKTIRIVLPFPAGGAGTDMMARLIGKKLSDDVGVPVVVDNKPGASTIIGAQEVAKAAPDGHTLFYTVVITHTQNPHLFAKLPYDPFKDFTPLSQVARSATVLIAGKNAPFDDLKGMIAHAKANPGKLNIASFSAGSTAHINAEMLRIASGVNIAHIPYKGVADAQRALLAGEVQLYFDGTATAVTAIKAGTAKGIAAATDKRISVLPELPTITEQGVAGIDIVGWQGFFGPGGMDPAVTQKISAAIAKIVKSDEITNLIKTQGNEPTGTTADAFQTIVKTDFERWGNVIRRTGIKLE
ncbi:MAG: tripartite tricarboxylate transporter substrate binding protein [Betaproteobacteria bacterium]|nr:MAG: tripartite tricarboxylate transporter substrate binding protein [Betaproteobacteria bacterium]TAG49165.1 MAG: tripartite tricarboxylate transporter substrate binding protein [Betaproteobacteria bacterium]